MEMSNMDSEGKSESSYTNVLGSCGIVNSGCVVELAKNSSTIDRDVDGELAFWHFDLVIVRHTIDHLCFTTQQQNDTVNVTAFR